MFTGNRIADQDRAAGLGAGIDARHYGLMPGLKTAGDDLALRMTAELSAKEDFDKPTVIGDLVDILAAARRNGRAAESILMAFTGGGVTTADEVPEPFSVDALIAAIAGEVRRTEGALAAIRERLG